MWSHSFGKHFVHVGSQTVVRWPHCDLSNCSVDVHVTHILHLDLLLQYFCGTLPSFYLLIQSYKNIFSSLLFMLFCILDMSPSGPNRQGSTGTQGLHRPHNHQILCQLGWDKEKLLLFRKHKPWIKCEDLVICLQKKNKITLKIN